MRAIERRWVARGVGAGTVAALAGLVAHVAGCSARDREPLPDWTSTNVDAGASPEPTEGGVVGEGDAVPNPIPSDHFGLRLPVLEYPARLRTVNTSDKPCSVKPATAPRAASVESETSCILDMDELDLAFHGLKFDVLTPTGGCDYVIYRPYFYVSWKFGEGPTNVSYTIHPDGTYSDEVNSENGRPLCEFDYSRFDVRFPNCCTGPYTVTIRSGLTGRTTTKAGSWGRRVPAACFDGAAFLLDNVKLDADGFPQDPIYFVDQLPRTIPIRHKDMLQYPRISVPLASFWQEGVSPARPTAAFKGPPPYGYDRSEYLIECVDHAEEVLARVHLHVRDWNEKTELAKDGDPNTGGDEPHWGGPPHPIDDWLDWAALRARGIEYTQVLRRVE